MKGLSPSKLSIISLNNINFLILGFVFFYLVISCHQHVL